MCSLFIIDSFIYGAMYSWVHQESIFKLCTHLISIIFSWVELGPNYNPRWLVLSSLHQWSSTAVLNTSWCLLNEFELKTDQSKNSYFQVMPDFSQEFVQALCSKLNVKKKAKKLKVYSNTPSSLVEMLTWM